MTRKLATHADRQRKDRWGPCALTSTGIFMPAHLPQALVDELCRPTPVATVQRGAPLSRTQTVTECSSGAAWLTSWECGNHVEWEQKRQKRRLCSPKAPSTL